MVAHELSTDIADLNIFFVKVIYMLMFEAGRKPCRQDTSFQLLT